MVQQKRIVFFISDSTGITAETIGHSLLSQFEGINFDRISLRYIDSMEKVQAVKATIERAAKNSGSKPLVFSTLVDPELRKEISENHGVFIDVFDAFISPLEKELHQPSSHLAGRTHRVRNDNDYAERMDAVNYALGNDDGVSTEHYDEADIILVGVSRSGKTPTCLYLALHYGVYAANYPLTEDDLLTNRLPPALKPYRSKLFGLTISCERLQRIRTERRPDSRYASLQQCRIEVAQAEELFQRHRIPQLDASIMSVEELATCIMNMTELERHTL